MNLACSYLIAVRSQQPLEASFRPFPNSKLTLEAVNEIRRLRQIKPRPTLAALAVRYGVKYMTIWSAAVGRTWVKSATAGRKLSADKVADIRARAAAGEPYKVLAPEHGVSIPTISDIVLRKTWRDAA